MRKRLLNVPTLLVLLILMYQIVFPIGTVFASASILPPSNFTFQKVTPDDGKLTWSAVFGATGYKVYEIKDGQLVLLGTTTAVSYSLNNQPEGTFRYVVSTISNDGESGPTAPVNAEFVYPDLLAPTGLTSSIRNGNDIVLNWGASQYAEKYNVYQISETGEKTLVTSTSAQTYNITKTEQGSYSYTVSAYHSLYGESPASETINVEVVYPVIKQPSNLSFTVSNGTNVTLKWQAENYATSYKIYEEIDGQLELKNTVTGTSVTFSNLPSKDYVYRVYTYSDRFGESAEGSQVSLTVSSIVMAPPNNLTYKIQNINDAVLSWESVPFATGYKVYQVVNGEKTLKSTVTGTGVTYTMLPGGEYEFEVYTYSNQFGESEIGSKLSLSIDTVPVYPPDTISYKIQNGNDIVLNWSSAANASNYKVYQIINGQKVLKNTITGTTTTFTNMPSGNYQFEVHTNSTRFGESDEGTQISLVLDPIFMNAPENADYVVNNGNNVAIKWDPVDYATSYKIYQIVDGEKVLKSTVSNTNVSLSNLPEGEIQYEIYSYSSRFGESQQGTNVSISLVYPEMNPPLNVTETIITPTRFTLSWDAAEYATSYKVYQIVNGQKVLKSTVTGTTISYNNILPGFYIYEVYSYSSRFGESQTGSSIDIVLSAQELVAPENLSYSITNGNDLSLKWDVVPYATSYKVYQIIEGEAVLKRTVTGTNTTFLNMPEGDFHFIINAYSTLLGESPYGAEAIGNIEFPELVKPDNVTYTINNGNDLSLRWNAVTYANGYKIYKIIDGEKVFIKTVSGTSTILTNLPEGDYLFEVHSYSDRFGESTEGNQLPLEIVFPIMQAPGNFTKTILNGNDFTLRWNAVNYVKEYRVYQIINGEKKFIKAVTGTSASFSNMPEGDYQYIVTSYSDRFGESEEGSVLSFNLTWPIVPAPNLNGTTFNANNMTLTWQAVTWANEYRVYKLDGEIKQLIYKGSALSHKVYNLTEDTHSFVVTAYSDRFGESVLSNRLDKTIVYPEMTSPMASLQLLSQTSARISWDFVTYANGYNVYEIVDGKPVQLVRNLNNLSYTVQNMSYANHEYYVTSYSNSFGESKPSETVIARLIIDIKAPETKSNAPTQWVNQNQLISLEATDDITGVEKTYYSLNNGLINEGTSILVDQEGINTISFNSIDMVGNVEQAKTAFVKVDKTAPTTTINEIPDYAQSYTVLLTGHDELSGVTKTLYSINGSEFIEGNTFVVENEGITEISYYSIDAAGNQEGVKTTKITIDNTAPITSDNGPGTWVKDDVIVSLTAKDEKSGVAKTYYSINGSDYVEGTTFTVDQVGINKISYYSVDVVGNKEVNKTVEVKIDKTAPKTSANTPKSWVKDDVIVTLTAEDENSGVVKTYYSINELDYVEGTTFTVDREGINEISYYSVDSAGNKEESKTVEVKIDKTAPKTSANTPEAWGKDDVIVTLTAEDENSGVVKTYYSINGLEYIEGTIFKVNLEGLNKISYYSIDSAGNIEVVKTVEVKIDKTAPKVSINVNNEYELGSTFTLNYFAEDELSGVVAEEVTLNGQSYKNHEPITLDQPGLYQLLIKVTDAAGWTTTVEKTFTVYLPVTLEVLPKVIKGNKGVFSVRANLPKEYQFSLYNVSTVTLNGILAVVDNKGLLQQAEKGHFKFNREDFTWETGLVTLEFRGYLNNGILVVAKATVASIN
jgi:large repetitive protein